MRILADENISLATVQILRNNGYDVFWVRTEAPGSNDREILAKAQLENRIIITFDKDFGELAYVCNLPSSSGIVLFRIPPLPPWRTSNFILATLRSRTDWNGHFTVVELDRIRMKIL